jgi:type IV pilus assembly protein PilQ
MIKIFSFIFLAFITSSCEPERKNPLKLDEPLIENESMLDKDKFIEQGKARSEREFKYGPEVVDAGNDFRKDSRTFIQKQKPDDFVNIAEGRPGEIFAVSLNVDNVDIRTFADMFSKIIGVNVLVSDEVKGNVTAKLDNVPWDEALDSVLKIKSLAKYVDTDAKIIRIHNQDKIAQIEDFERLRRENIQKSIQLQKSIEPVYTEIYKLYYTKPKDIKSALEGTLGIGEGKESKAENGVSTSAEITIDERMNLLIVKSRKDDMEMISKLIKELDKRTKQVYIEAFIVEVTDGFDKAFGTRFGVNGVDDYTKGSKLFNGRVTGLGGTASSSVDAGDGTASVSNLPVTGATSGIGILAGIGSSADLKIELTALESEGLSKVISNPRVFTLDNKEAIIFQGKEVPYETVSDAGTQVQFKEAGLKLAVTPKIIGDGNLMLDITVNKDTVDTTISNPPITKSEIKTSLVSKDGQIVVIGGIYSETKNKTKDQVPGLGDVPGVGGLFKRKTREEDKTELIIFISPKIL